MFLRARAGERESWGEKKRGGAEWWDCGIMVVRGGND